MSTGSNMPDRTDPSSAAALRRGALVSVSSRIVAAVFGGYTLATVTAIGLAGILPMGRGDAVMTGLLLSFVFYCLAVLWAFATRSALRAWIGIAAWTAVFGIVALATGGAAA